MQFYYCRQVVRTSRYSNVADLQKRLTRLAKIVDLERRVVRISDAVEHANRSIGWPGSPLRSRQDKLCPLSVDSSNGSKRSIS